MTYSIRIRFVANGVADVMPNIPFDIVVANFSRTKRSLPKNTVAGYATRNPLPLFGKVCR